MVSKYLICFLVILTLSEGRTRQLQNEIDDALAAYDELQEKVQSAIDTATNELNTLSQGVADLVDSTLTDGTKQINNIFNELLEELNELKQLAAKSSIDITNCTEDDESTFLELPGQLVTELSTCINNEAATSLSTVNSTLSDISKTWESVVQVGEDLENCGDTALCLTELIGTMAEDEIEIPEQISADIIKVEEKLDTLTVKLATCSSAKVTSMTDTGGELVEQIASCIEAKIIS